MNALINPPDNELRRRQATAEKLPSDRCNHPLGEICLNCFDWEDESGAMVWAWQVVDNGDIYVG